MASGKTAAEAARLLDASNGVVAYTAPTTPMKLALVTVIGSAAAAGTEVTGGSYARQTVTYGASGGTPSVSNSGAINYTNMPAATTVGVDEFDSNGTPRRSWWGALTTSKTTASGDTLSFAAAALVKTDS